MEDARKMAAAAKSEGFVELTDDEAADVNGGVSGAFEIIEGAAPLGTSANFMPAFGDETAGQNAPEGETTISTLAFKNNKA